MKSLEIRSEKNIFTKSVYLVRTFVKAFLLIKFAI